MENVFQEEMKWCSCVYGMWSVLAAGRSIGNGLIEGACKNLVKRRLRQTGACWRGVRANRIAAICSVLYSDQWKACWKKSAKTFATPIGR